MNRRRFFSWIAAAAVTLCLALPSSLSAAFTEFYVQTTGSNLNAGSTTANAASLTYAAGTWVSATRVFTVASGNPVTDGVAVGDFAAIDTGGATAANVARVTASTATTITLAGPAGHGANPADGTYTLRIGGAWKGPNAAEGFPFGFVANVAAGLNAAGDYARVNFKSGTNYAITAAITHANNSAHFQGYTTTPGDGGRATIDGGTTGASYTLLTVSGTNCNFADLIFANNGATGSATGLNITGVEILLRGVVVNSVRGNGIWHNTGSTNFVVIECEIYGANQSNTANAGAFVNTSGGGFYDRCIAHDNSSANITGFYTTQNTSYSRCIADTNGQYGFFSSATTSVVYSQCEAYNNTSDGIRLGNTSAAVILIESCNLIKNGGWGINGSGGGTRNGAIVNCGFGSGTQANTSGTVTGLSAMEMPSSGPGVSVTYAANLTPWRDPANGNFSTVLAAAKRTGRNVWTQTAPSYSGTTSYRDIGAAQSAGGILGGGGLR